MRFAKFEKLLNLINSPTWQAFRPAILHKRNACRARYLFYSAPSSSTNGTPAAHATYFIPPRHPLQTERLPRTILILFRPAILYKRNACRARYLFYSAPSSSTNGTPAAHATYFIPPRHPLQTERLPRTILILFRPAILYKRNACRARYLFYSAPPSSTNGTPAAHDTYFIPPRHPLQTERLPRTLLILFRPAILYKRNACRARYLFYSAPSSSTNGTPAAHATYFIPPRHPLQTERLPRTILILFRPAILYKRNACRARYLFYSAPPSSTNGTPAAHDTYFIPPRHPLQTERLPRTLLILFRPAILYKRNACRARYLFYSAPSSSTNGTPAAHATYFIPPRHPLQTERLPRTLLILFRPAILYKRNACRARYLFYSAPSSSTNGTPAAHATYFIPPRHPLQTERLPRTILILFRPAILYKRNACRARYLFYSAPPSSTNGTPAAHDTYFIPPRHPPQTERLPRTILILFRPAILHKRNACRARYLFYSAPPSSTNGTPAAHDTYFIPPRHPLQTERLPRTILILFRPAILYKRNACRARYLFYSAPPSSTNGTPAAHDTYFIPPRHPLQTERLPRTILILFRPAILYKRNACRARYLFYSAPPSSTNGTPAAHDTYFIPPRHPLQTERLPRTILILFRPAILYKRNACRARYLFYSAPPSSTNGTPAAHDTYFIPPRHPLQTERLPRTILILFRPAILYKRNACRARYLFYSAPPSSTNGTPAAQATYFITHRHPLQTERLPRKLLVLLRTVIP